MRDVVTNQQIDSFKTGDSVIFRIAVKVNEPTANYRFSIRILDPAGTIVSFVDIPNASHLSMALYDDAVLECTIEHINLLPGEYWIDLVAKEVGGPVIDSISFAFSFFVSGNIDIIQRTENRGIIYLPASWRLAAE